MTSVNRPFLAHVIAQAHTLFVIYFVFGWILPKAFLLWHLCSIPLVILHWKLNNDQCVLTQWQRRLEGKELSSDDEGGFIKALFLKMGIELSRKQLFWVIYGMLIVSGMISGLRLLSS